MSVKIKIGSGAAREVEDLRFINGVGINFSGSAGVSTDDLDLTVGIAWPGTAFYVDGTNGLDANGGTSWTDAKKTIQAAVGLCTTNKYDIVYVTAGTYAENVTVTSKHNIRFVGLVSGANSKRVAIAPASGIALTIAQSNRLAFHGFRFVGTSGVGVKSDGESAYFGNCDFTSDTSHGIEFLGATDTDYTGSGTTFNNCLFRECGGAGIRLSKGTGAVLGLQATNVNVWGSQFYLNTGDDIDDDAGTGSPTYFYQWEISGNKFLTRNKAVYLDMDGGVSAECLISNNWFANDGAALTATQIALATGAVFAGNFDANGVRDGSAL